MFQDDDDTGITLLIILLVGVFFTVLGGVGFISGKLSIPF